LLGARSRSRIRQARRQAGSSHGYKAHVGVDHGSGLIRSVITTPANVKDTVPVDALIRGDEKALLADAADHTPVPASPRSPMDRLADELLDDRTLGRRLFASLALGAALGLARGPRSASVIPAKAGMT
jgi:hypothetical protein